MGKYMKKSKTAGDVAVMEVSPQSSLGVRTRAKTLALQTLQKSSSSSSSSSSSFSSPADASSFSYLQLRSRRLRKVVVGSKKPEQPPPRERDKKCFGEGPNTNCCGVTVNSRVREGSVESESLINEKEEHFLGEFAKGSEAGENLDVAIEGSFGENILEVEGRDRSTRESTPCSLIRDSNTVSTPGSSTRQRMSTTTNQIIYEHMQRNIPKAYEMEEFFAFAEKQQQRIFMEKYNFDVVNDVPLPGRYEWIQVLH